VAREFLVVAYNDTSGRDETMAFRYHSSALRTSEILRTKYDHVAIFMEVGGDLGPTLSGDVFWDEEAEFWKEMTEAWGDVGFLLEDNIVRGEE